MLKKNPENTYFLSKISKIYPDASHDINTELKKFYIN